MKFQSILGAVSASLVFLVSISTANAALVTVTANGTMTAATSGNIFNYSAGDDANLSFSYDTESSPIASSSGGNVYAAEATFSFGVHTFSGDATISVSNSGFLVQPALGPNLGLGWAELVGVTYSGPADISGVLFASGGFSWFDTQFPIDTFPNFELVELLVGQLGFNVQNGTYQLPSQSGTQSENIGYYYNYNSVTVSATTVPIPAAIWLFGSGLLGLIGVARKKA